MDQKLLGSGIAFPVRLEEGQGLRLANGVEKVRESIWLILSTKPGERVMRPNFGCAVHELLFYPNTAAIRGLAAEKVREALVKWEPRIDVLNVSAETAPDSENRILITIEYRIRKNNAFNNLVFPFYLAEGQGEGGEAVA